MNFDALTDQEIIRLNELLHEEEIYQRRLSLLDFRKDKNPNYTLLAESRANLKYIDEELVSGNSVVILEGSSRCFDEDQRVVTKDGAKRIKDVRPNDQVLTFNEETKQNEYKPVVSRLKFRNNQKKCLRLTLKNGETITATEDHEFYYEGAWVALKHLVSLFHDKNKDKH